MGPSPRKLPRERLKKIFRGKGRFSSKVPKRHTFMAYIKFGSDLKKFKQRVYYWQQVPAKGAGQDENAYDPSNSSCTTLDYSQTPFRWEISQSLPRIF
jgi:hypothetical protein